MFEKLFKLTEKKSTVKTEVFAGITTFLAMAYILGVNPGMLATEGTGMPFQSVFLATAIASAIACLIMGLVANYPVGLSAGMGVNAFFTYTCIFTMGFTYQEALAAVFVSGAIFLIISVTGIRKTIINSIPKNLKLAIGAGIGFFIAFIGFSNAGIVVANSATKVALGDVSNPTVLLSLFGLVVTIGLMAKKVNAAVFYGLLATAVFGVILGVCGISGMPGLPTSIVSFDFDMPTAGSFLDGFKTLFTRAEAFVVIFTFLFIDFFDTAGTLVAVGNDIGLVNEEGELENVERALLADSIGTMIGSTLGTSTITSFVESGAGVAAGGKTGLTACTTGVLFFLSIFFMPLLSVVNAIPVTIGDAQMFLSPVTAPALIVVGILMVSQLKDVEWEKFEVAAAGFMTIAIMVLTYSISNGIAAGFLIYSVADIFGNKGKNLKPITLVLDVIFILHFWLS